MNGFDRVRDVFATIDRRLGLIDQVLPYEDVHRFVLPTEQTGNGAPVDEVPFAFEPPDLGHGRIEPAEIVETADRGPHRSGCPEPDVNLHPKVREWVAEL